MSKLNLYMSHEEDVSISTDFWVDTKPFKNMYFWKIIQEGDLKKNEVIVAILSVRVKLHCVQRWKKVVEAVAPHVLVFSQLY